MGAENQKKKAKSADTNYYSHYLTIWLAFLFLVCILFKKKREENLPCDSTLHEIASSAVYLFFIHLLNISPLIFQKISHKWGFPHTSLAYSRPSIVFLLFMGLIVKSFEKIKENKKDGLVPTGANSCGATNIGSLLASSQGLVVVERRFP